MLNFLRRLFQKSEKNKQVLVTDLVYTPSAKFEFDVLNHVQRGISQVWRQTSDIDELSEQISYLMEVRQKRVQERSELVTVINKQRKLLDLEEIDEEGVTASELPADDETYALES